VISLVRLDSFAGTGLGGGQGDACTVPPCAVCGVETDCRYILLVMIYIGRTRVMKKQKKSNSAVISDELKEEEKERTHRTKDPPLALPRSRVLRNHVLNRPQGKSAKSKTTPKRAPVTRSISNTFFWPRDAAPGRHRRSSLRQSP